MQRGLSRSSRRDLAERRDDDRKVPASEEEAHVESRLPLRLVIFSKGLDRGALYRVGSQAWMGNNHHPRRWNPKSQRRCGGRYFSGWPDSWGPPVGQRTRAGQGPNLPSAPPVTRSDWAAVFLNAESPCCSSKAHAFLKRKTYENFATE